MESAKEERKRFSDLMQANKAVKNVLRYMCIRKMLFYEKCLQINFKDEK